MYRQDNIGKFKDGTPFPLYFEDMDYESIVTLPYTPIEDLLDNAYTSLDIRTGFCAMNATDEAGYFYAITWNKYIANNKSFTGLTPQKLYAAAYDWVYTPLAKIYSSSDDTYPSTITVIQVAFLQSYPLGGLILKDGDVWFRKLVRGGKYCIDKSTDGGVTYTLNLVSLEPDEENIIILIDAGVDGYRQVVRDGALCIDMELTATGFDGVEDTDWENVIQIDTE
jgi:hypothetical protein